MLYSGTPRIVVLLCSRHCNITLVALSSWQPPSSQFTQMRWTEKSLNIRVLFAVHLNVSRIKRPERKTIFLIESIHRGVIGIQNLLVHVVQMWLLCNALLPRPTRTVNSPKFLNWNYAHAAGASLIILYAVMYPLTGRLTNSVTTLVALVECFLWPLHISVYR